MRGIFSFFSPQLRNVRSLSSSISVPGLSRTQFRHENLVKYSTSTRFLHSNANDEILSDSSGKSIKQEVVHLIHDRRGQDGSYKDSADPVVKEIHKCESWDELTRIYEDSLSTHSPSHIVQIINRLWDIPQKPNADSTLPESLLTTLESVKDQLDLHDLCSGIFYLSKLLPDISSIQPLVEYSLERTRNEEKVDLLSLSRLSVIREIPYFYAYSIIIPRIEDHLKRNDLSSEDLLHLTVSMKQFVRYLSDDLIELYRQRISSLEKTGFFEHPDSSGNQKIIKICHFLNSSPFSMKNSSLVRKLMQNVDVAHLDTPQDLNVVFKIIQSQLEPRPLMGSVLNQAIEMRKKEAIIHPLLLQCEVLNTLPMARRDLVDNVEEYLMDKKEILSTEDVLLIFKILRKAKVSKSRLCNIYWNKVLEKIKAEPGEQESDRLIHHCHRYMYFNNNLGGTYRYFSFERFVLNLIMTELREGISQFVPAKLSRLSAFLIGYGTSDQIPPIILDKLIACRGQFTVSDCLQLSRGIQIALEMRFRKGLPHESARQILLLEQAIDEAIKMRVKETRELSITDANIIIRGLTMRKSNQNSEIYQRVFNRYCKVDFEVTSRKIRDTTMNLTLSRIKADDLLESFLAYIIQQSSSITGDTVEKILHSCFSLGHETSNHEALKLGAEIVERDFEFMSGLGIVNTCLALCFYGDLSRDLMAKVFCIEFIKRLEDEIKICYSKATYPQKVLNRVMQLNRSVCLDYPEYNVPWFQQNYVEAQTTKSSPNELFQKDVLRRLKDIFCDQVERIELNYSTAYGYRLDFLLKLDDKGKLMPKDSDKYTRRLAVILLSPTSFCQNDPNSPCGYEQLRRRHLEILGFEVFEISHTDWTSSKLTVDHLRQVFIARNIVVQE